MAYPRQADKFGLRVFFFVLSSSAMTLREYIDQHNLRQRELARRWGMPESTLSDLLNGRRRPSIELASKIKRLSDGAVPLDAWEAPA